MPKALSHGADVAALFVVVRSVVDELARNGRPIREHARAGLDLLERWIGGAEVDAAELVRAQGLVHENDVPLAEREQDRARSWANTAVGNLLWMAQKTRGWKGAHPGIMDACIYALSCLGVPGLPDGAALEAMRVAAAAGGQPVPARRSRGVAPRRVGATLVPFIGKAANARLRALEAVFDPALRASEAELRQVLEAHAYPTYASVFAFDARYGGLVMAEAPGEAGNDWCFGAYACLKQGAHVAPRGGREGLVPVAYSPNDVIYFLDADGAAWAQDTIEDTHAQPCAADGNALVALIVAAAR